jgi:hypothetical protein
MTTPITTKQKDIPPQPNSIGYGEDVWSYRKEWGLDQLVQEEKNEVLLDPLQQIGDSIYWTQSIAPGKFYSRVGQSIGGGTDNDYCTMMSLESD